MLFSVYDGAMTAVDEPLLDRLRLRYQRVQEALAEELARERRPAGSPFPPEAGAAEHFGVSRVTMRRALDELEDAGIVSRTPGGGWAVAGPRIGEPPNQLMSFSEMAASRGLTPVPASWPSTSGRPRSTRRTRSASRRAPRCSSPSDCG